MIPLPLRRLGVPRARQHRHTRSSTELVIGKRSQSRRLRAALRHRSGKSQVSGTLIRGHRGCHWLTWRPAPVRVDIDIHVHELVAIPALAHLPSPPLPSPPRCRRRGRGNFGCLCGTTRRRLLSLGAQARPRAGPDTGRANHVGRHKTRATRGRRWCRCGGIGNGTCSGRGRSAWGRARCDAGNPYRRRGGRRDDRQHRGRSRYGCWSGGRRRNGGQPGQSREAAHSRRGRARRWPGAPVATGSGLGRYQFLRGGAASRTARC